MFRTLKEYKSAFVVGARLVVIDHWRKELAGTVRVVDKPQGRQYRYRTEGNPDGKPSWGDHPKRSEIEFHDDGSFTVRIAPDPRFPDSPPKFWRLKFLDPLPVSESAA